MFVDADAPVSLLFVRWSWRWLEVGGKQIRTNAKVSRPREPSLFRRPPSFLLLPLLPRRPASQRDKQQIEASACKILAAPADS